MKFGLFDELPVPRPWTRDSERVVSENALEQVRLADEPGFDQGWAVDPHDTFHKPERGRPLVSRFEASTRNAEPRELVMPISASATTCDTDRPALRFVMDPEVPVAQGTRRLR
jgi:hypothetical protein